METQLNNALPLFDLSLTHIHTLSHTHTHGTDRQTGTKMFGHGGGGGGGSRKSTVSSRPPSAPARGDKGRGDHGVVIPGLRPGFHGTPKRDVAGMPAYKNAAHALGAGGGAGAGQRGAAGGGGDGWQPPVTGWQQARIAAASGAGDSEAGRERKGLVYTLNNAQIWAAYDSIKAPTGAGGIRSLTRDQLLAAFKSANGIELDPAVVDAIYQSVDPSTAGGCIS